MAKVPADGSIVRENNRRAPCRELAKEEERDVDGDGRTSNLEPFSDALSDTRVVT